MWYSSTLSPEEQGLRLLGGALARNYTAYIYSLSQGLRIKQIRMPRIAASIMYEDLEARSGRIGCMMPPECRFCGYPLEVY
jgi:hypothetical protein